MVKRNKLFLGLLLAAVLLLISSLAARSGEPLYIDSTGWKIDSAYPATNFDYWDYKISHGPQWWAIDKSPGWQGFKYIDEYDAAEWFAFTIHIPEGTGLWITEKSGIQINEVYTSTEWFITKPHPRLARLPQYRIYYSYDLYAPVYLSRDAGFDSHPRSGNVAIWCRFDFGGSPPKEVFSLRPIGITKGLR